MNKTTKVKAKDIDKTILNLFNIEDYSIKENIITLYLHSGNKRNLIYKSKKKAKKRYSYFLKLEEDWQHYEDMCLE